MHGVGYFPLRASAERDVGNSVLALLATRSYAGAGCCAVSPALPVLVTVEAGRAVAGQTHFCCRPRDLALCLNRR